MLSQKLEGQIRHIVGIMSGILIALGLSDQLVFDPTTTSDSIVEILGLISGLVVMVRSWITKDSDDVAAMNITPLGIWGIFKGRNKVPYFYRIRSSFMLEHLQWLADEKTKLDREVQSNPEAKFRQGRVYGAFQSLKKVVPQIYKHPAISKDLRFKDIEQLNWGPTQSKENS